MATKQLKRTVKLHPTQAAFCRSPARRRGFVGGRGAGKSWVGAYDLITRAMSPDGRGRLYLAGNATYGQLEDTTIRSFKEVAQFLGVWEDARYRVSPHPEYRLPGGSDVLFRAAEKEDRFRGPNLSGIWLDEASLIKESAYLTVIGCLREKGRSGWISATFTPKGKAHWTYIVFGKPKRGTELFHAPTAANPFLPDDYESDLREQYISSLADQELGGNFTDPPGQIFDTSRVKILQFAPVAAQRVRYWDKASVEKGGDYTAGVLIAKAGGVYYVEHVLRGQFSAGQRNQHIRRTAQLDSQRGQEPTVTWVEQEPGSGGKESAEITIQELAGYPIFSERPTGSKVTRAMPFAAQVEAGNVHLIAGDWNAEYLDELQAFPGGAHDDQVDASSGAFAKLVHSGSAFKPTTAEHSDTIMGSMLDAAFQ